MKKVVLAGGSGYIGAVLSEYYSSKATEVIVISRTMKQAKGNVRTITWDGAHVGEWSSSLERADLLINLTGKNVNCRYTADNKKEILESRLNATEVLGQAIQTLENPPAAWIQFASATIYRHAEDHFMDEDHGEIGTGFSIDVCKAWEEMFWQQHTPSTRKILLRTSIVLGASGGAFPILYNMTRAGLGGRQGNGGQYISWIHEQDVCAVVDWLYSRKELSGIYNCTSPHPVINSQFMTTLRKTSGAMVGLPAPVWLLKVGAAIIGTEPELILKSRWVMPGRLIREGFNFQFPSLAAALHDLIRK